MVHWYFGENGQQHGPVEEAWIRQAISAGQLNLQTLVWREGMPNWLPLAQVPELQGGGGNGRSVCPASGDAL